MQALKGLLDVDWRSSKQYFLQNPGSACTRGASVVFLSCLRSRVWDYEDVPLVVRNPSLSRSRLRRLNVGTLSNLSSDLNYRCRSYMSEVRTEDTSDPAANAEGM